ncbi:HET-domain-containing protein [Astrocystis sublimbata]|nr:HET-domain-containing protein [Astrocystis sublimbata]
MANYKYSSLPCDEYIRIATIFAGNDDDDLTISITNETFQANSPPLYEALSYVWGSEDDKQPVRIPDGHGRSTLYVTRNLHIALRHLRYNDRPRRMWIDAICIDQSNTVEKGPQVERMGEIYQLAARVVAWLGPAEDDSSTAMARMDYIGSQITLDPSGQIVPADLSSDARIADHQSRLDFPDQDMRAVYHLICRPWFDRLWIRQEIFLANASAVIKCGASEMLWARFHLALRCLFLKPSGVSSDARLRRQLGIRTIALQGFIFQPPIVHFDDFRRIFENCLCRDPRDRIYGVRSMLTETERAACGRPDYAKPWTDVYQRIVQQMVHSRKLNVLRDCELAPGDPSPSWIPTWYRKTTEPMQMSPMLASSSIRAHYEFSENGTLRVAGVVKAMVKSSQPFSGIDNAGRPNPYDEIRDMLPAVSDPDEPYCTGISMLEALARTFVMDVHCDSYTPCPADIRAQLSDGGFQTMLRMVSGTTYDPRHFQPRSPCGDYLAQIVFKNGDKRFIECTDGYIGIAPPSTQAGDEVCVLLGCDAPMVLRSLGSGRYLVVGECFVEGLSMGEALLGLLPKEIRATKVQNEDSERWDTLYLNQQTGQVLREDPRLRQLPIDLTGFRNDLETKPMSFLDIDLDILRQRGVDVQYLKLV